VLVSAGAYFANTWREDNSAVEQAVLRDFATGEGDHVLTVEYQTAIQSLRRKEMLERTADGYRLAVPLFGRWIVKNQVAEACRNHGFERVDIIETSRPQPGYCSKQ
jgi:uncharacterized protein